MTKPRNARRDQGTQMIRTGRRPRLEPLEDRMLLATFTVTDTSDSVSDTGSLRYAITQSNLTGPGPNVINFDITGTGVQTISPATALPAATVPVTIDGTVQPGYQGLPLIVLDGTNAGSTTNGLTINAPDSTIEGLAVDSFGGDGIVLSGSGDVVMGCFVGVDAAGTVAAGNGGLYGIDCTADDITIGGTAAGAGNVISGNNGDGIEFQGHGTGDVVQGNDIGTNSTGTKALPNRGNGILVEGPGGALIGGTIPGARNIISGNGAFGVLTYTASDLIEGNYIGTDVTGTVAVPNEEGGVSLANEGSGVATGGSTIGGTAAGAGNVISGNGSDGIVLLTNSNVVEGNLIGTDATGSVAMPNDGSGISIGAEPGGVGSDNIIGGTVAAARNVISGNTGGATGVGGVFLGLAGSGNVIEGNDIGTDITGTKALGNEGAGVGLESGSADDTVGGTTSGAGNVIAGNTGDGVDVFIPDVLVEGNLIGTDAGGTKALPNGGDGVYAGNTVDDTIGGTTAAARNIISGNANYGVSIPGGDATDDLVEGNDIGTDVTGTVGLGNGASGVFISAQSNTIGGTAAGAGNVISANGTAQGQYSDGITISGGTFGSAGNMIQGNLIGTDVTGKANLGNFADGVYFTGGASSNLVGGSTTNAPNVIAFNGDNGVHVDQNSIMDTISQNSIFGNTNLGINLESASGYAGGNNLEPAPVLTTCSTLASGSVQTGWTLSAAASTTFTVEFFASALGSASGVEEGQTFLSSMAVTTDSTGNASFTLTAALPAGETFLTATATDPSGNTSQFSLQATTTALNSSVNPSTLGEGVTFTAVVANPATGTPTGAVTFTIDGHAEPPVDLAVVNGVDQAVFSTGALTLGPNTISAAYSGDPSFAASGPTSLTQTVNPALAGTSTSLSAAPNPSTFGQNVTFTAVVAPMGPTESTLSGNVTFTIDGQAEPPAALALVDGAYQATLSTTALSVGQHTISAAYDGNNVFGSSAVQNPVVETVNAPTSTMLMSPVNPSLVGQSVTLTATVTGPDGAGAPTGSVSFDEGGTVLHTATLDSSGQATFPTSTLAVGQDAITAVYTPTGGFIGSSSMPLTQVVNAAPLVATMTQLVSSPNPSAVGQFVTFIAVVTSGGAGTPVGNVTFTIDGQAEPPAALAVVDGVDEASIAISTLTAGGHTIGAAYTGGADFATSQAIPLSQSVSAATGVTSPATTSTDGPRIVSVDRYGYHMRPTVIVLTFDQALDAVTAEDSEDYRIIGPAGRTIAIKEAVYNAAALTVTLHPVCRISIHHTYELLVDGTSPHGLTNTGGQLLDGADTGSPDSNYRATLTWRNLMDAPPSKAMHSSKR